MQDGWARRLPREQIAVREAEYFASVTDGHFGFEGKPSGNFRPQRGATDSPAYDKRAGRADAHDIESL